MFHFDQVLRKALMDTFANDVFLGMVTAADVHSSKLCKTLKTFHMNVTNAMSCDTWKHMAPVHATYARMHSISKALLSVLLPSPEIIGLSARDSLALVDYKGSEALEAAIQGAMQEKKFWRRCIDSTNRTAGTAKEQFPVLKECFDKSKDALNGGCRPEIWLSVLAECLPKLDGLRKGLKPGATHDLEAFLLQMIGPTAKYIASEKSAEKIDTDKVSVLADCVDLFGEAELQLLGLAHEATALSQLHQKIQHWQANMACNISEKKMEKMMETWMHASDAGNKIEIDWEEFGKLLMSLDGIPDALHDKAAACVYLMLCDLEEKA